MMQEPWKISELEKLEALAWMPPVSIQEPVMLFREDNRLVGALLHEPIEVLAIEAWDDDENKFVEIPAELYSIMALDLRENGNGGHIVLESSRLPFLKPEELVRPLGDPMAYPTTRDGSMGMLFSETGLFHKTSVLVTYTHEVTWSGWKPTLDSTKLPRTRHLLASSPEQNEKLDIFVFGDSISTGCNCSDMLHLFPGYHSYPDLIVALIGEKVPGLAVRLKNASVGGQSSGYGKKSIKKIIDDAREYVKVNPPFHFDLNIIAWGANDAAGTSRARGYAKNIDAQITSIVNFNPRAEFFLVASSMMNEAWNLGNNDYLFEYQTVLDDLASKWGTRVMVADMTRLWKEILARKSYYDLTGNGLNHPNDMGHRLYAQVLAVSLGLIK